MAERAPERIDRNTLVALGAMTLGVLVLANDFSALGVAIPAIESEFDSQVSTVQWVINAYALVFGVLIVTGGRLADMLGRRRMFLAGTVIFAAFSLLGGAAQSEAWLIAARALMGIGGALMLPAILGMTYEMLPASKAGLAGGIILGAAGLGNAIGPLVGGSLTDALSWRWVLYVNLPVAALAALVVWRTVHVPPAQDVERRIDYPGVAALSIGLVAFMVALDQATDWGFGDLRVLVLLAVSAALVTAFFFVERRAGPGALVPPDVMGNRAFAAACFSVLLMSATFFAALVYLPQFMQKLLGYSPLEAGVGLLPLMILFAGVSLVAGRLYERLGAKLIVSTGAACVAIGALLLSLVDAGSGYEALLPGMVVLGIGIGLFLSTITTAGVTALDPSRASLAGGIVYMFQIGGGSVGLAATTTVFTAASKSGLESDLASLGTRISERQEDAIYAVLGGTESLRQELSRFGPEVSARLTELVRESFVTGFEWAFRLDFALALAGLVVAVLFVGGRLHLGRGRAKERPVEAPAETGSARAAGRGSA